MRSAAARLTSSRQHSSAVRFGGRGILNDGSRRPAGVRRAHRPLPQGCPRAPTSCSVKSPIRTGCHRVWKWNVTGSGTRARRSCKHSDIVLRHEAALLVSAALLGPHRARARPGDDQPGVLAARSADLPVRHRQLRDPVLPNTRRASSSAASRCCSPRRSASRSSRAWPRIFRTTTSTSSRSGSAPSSTPTASAIRSSCRTRCSRISAAAKRSASCRRCGPTSSG